MPEILLLAQLAATLFLTGLIWCIQCVHYPLFKLVGEAGFVHYQKRHMVAITPIVFPPMLTELLTAASMFWLAPAAIPAWAITTGFALVTLIWLSTMALQVPAHNRLCGGFDSSAHQRLCITNWIRTFAWSARSGLLLWMVGRLLLHP